MKGKYDKKRGRKMSITLRKLCKYANENYDMKLICGQKSLNNIVSWVHMLEDPETAKFLHGQELVFTTGIGHNDTSWFIDFVKGLVKRQASGWVLNIGPYIESVPEEVFEHCKKVNFPLFTIPWKTRIVDITNDFCHKIVKDEEIEVSVAAAFRKAILYPEKSSEYSSVLVYKEFDIEAKFCIVAISLQVPLYEQFTQLDKIVRFHLKKILFNYSDRFSIFRQNEYLIIVLQNFTQYIIEKVLDRLKESLNYGDNNFEIYAGISSNGVGVKTLSQNYKRGIAVLNIAKKQGTYQLAYHNIGIFQLFIEIEDTNVLKNLYDETLGKLEAHDEKNETDYLEILQCYLENNNSVEKVAKSKFMHRNTINYKIKKIKEILQTDLNYEEGLRLFLAFRIKDFL